MSKPTITVGIPTHEVGESLSLALESILKQTFSKFIDEIIIVVDGNKKESFDELKKKDKRIKFIIYEKRQGQSSRINNILKLSKSDLTILTNDDVLLQKDAIMRLLKFKNFDLIAGNAIPLGDGNFISQIIDIGAKINDRISQKWNDGDNYLACNGRLIMISRNFSRKIVIPDKMWNNDAYMYIWCKENKYRFVKSKLAKCFYKSPLILREHFNQSSKFQKSQFEISKYFKSNLEIYYTIPIEAKMFGYLSELLESPIKSIIFIGLFLYTRLKNSQQSVRIPSVGYWETDRSTKRF